VSDKEQSATQTLAQDAAHICECCGAAIVRIEMGRAYCAEGCSYTAETT
jgi:hypothetical protein